MSNNVNEVIVEATILASATVTLNDEGISYEEEQELIERYFFFFFPQKKKNSLSLLTKKA